MVGELYRAERFVLLSTGTRHRAFPPAAVAILNTIQFTKTRVLPGRPHRSYHEERVQIYLLGNPVEFL